MKHILMIDDDAFLVESVSQLLAGRSYSVKSAGTAQDGFRQIVDAPPDLLILDLGLPDEDGITLCQRIRVKWKFPILMLTSRTDLVDKVLGLEVGADDYLTKPFEGRELLARVNACLRRTTDYQGSKGTSLSFSNLNIDRDRMVVSVNEKSITVTALEFRLLCHLAENAGIVLQRNRLFEAVWGYEDDFNSNSLDVFVYRLRTKLERAGAVDVIQTVRGVGYKFGPSND